MSLISVIVPIYNVEKYLERCIDSIINQKHNDLEILLINDGSTDKSGLICDDMAMKYNNIIVVHQSNQGLGAARNLGLDICKGEYIFFVDSDDYILPNIINNLYMESKKYNADIACCGYQSGKKKYYVFNNIRKMNGMLATKSMFMNDGMDANAVCKLYKKYLFEDIRYPNCAYEVVPVTYQVFLKANIVINIGKCGYYIEKREGSITRTEFSENNILYISMADDVKRIMKEKYTSLELASNVFYLNALISMSEKAQLVVTNNMNKEIEAVMNKFNAEYFNILKNGSISVRKKIISILIRCKIYLQVYKFYKSWIG